MIFIKTEVKLHTWQSLLKFWFFFNRPNFFKTFTISLIQNKKKKLTFFYFCPPFEKKKILKIIDVHDTSCYYLHFIFIFKNVGHLFWPKLIVIIMIWVHSFTPLRNDLFYYLQILLFNINAHFVNKNDDAFTPKWGLC